MLERNQVIESYRLLLGRDPESEAAIEHMTRASDLASLGRIIMDSPEFRRRASLGGLRASSGQWVCAEIRAGLRLWVDLMDLGVGAGALRDDWEHIETEFLLGQLRTGDHLLDIGGNIGWFSVLGAHRVGPTGWVTSIEPRTDLFRRLSASMSENNFLGRCDLHNLALGTEAGELPMGVFPDENNPGHSFLITGAADAGVEMLMSVPVRRLDTIGLKRKVDVIKIDTEGAEAIALSGGMSILKQDKPIIMSEFYPAWLRKVSAVEPKAYLDMLRDCGYRIFELGENGPDKLIPGLPDNSDKEGFFTNIVAFSEGQSYAVRNPAPFGAADQISGRELENTQLMRLERVERHLETINAQSVSVEMQLADFEKKSAALHADVMHRLVGLDRLPHIEAVLEEVKKRRKSVLSKVAREIRRPFTKAYREKKRLKREAKAIDAQFAKIGKTFPQDWEEVVKQRQAIAAFAGVDRPIAMIIDDRFPEPDRDSGSLDAVNMISSLTECGYHVVFAASSPRQQETRYIDGVREMAAYPLLQAEAPSLDAFIAEHGHHVDLFILSRVGSGGAFFERIKSTAPQSKVIFNTVDLHYVRESRAARLNNDSEALAASEYTRRREEMLVDKSDLTFVVSTTEEEILQASLPGCVTSVLPLARKISYPDVGFDQRHGLGFIGGFEHAPNIDALRYFLAEIWPIIHAADPSIKFSIVGSALPQDVLVGAPGNVEYLGALPEVDSWFSSLRMTVAPLRIGAGAKGKVASSLSNGLPCVISSVAAEGMELKHGVNVLIGDNPQEFAANVLRLHGDSALWDDISKGGLALAEARLSVRHFKEIVRDSIIRLELPAKPI